MIDIIYPPVFIKKFSKLGNDLQEECYQKINLFKNRKNHISLKVHKLHGKFKNCLGFSVNYKFRVIFRYVSKDEVLFLDIDDHDIYK